MLKIKPLVVNNVAMSLYNISFLLSWMNSYPWWTHYPGGRVPVGVVVSLLGTLVTVASPPTVLTGVDS